VLPGLPEFPDGVNTEFFGGMGSDLYPAKLLKKRSQANTSNCY